jgi:hypothetical protein
MEPNPEVNYYEWLEWYIRHTFGSSAVEGIKLVKTANELDRLAEYALYVKKQKFGL